MANIVITTTTEGINVDFGVYSTSLERLEGYWHKVNIHVKRGVDFVEVDAKGEKMWYVSAPSVTPTTPSLTIDLINGVVPSDNQDLYDKLTSILG